MYIIFNVSPARNRAVTQWPGAESKLVGLYPVTEKKKVMVLMTGEK